MLFLSLTVFSESSVIRWAILFSHPADFTPVCTTEIGRLALKYDSLAAMDCLVATLSVDPVKSHNEWLTDVVAHCENKIEIKFPIIGDQDRKVSIAYGMIDPGNLDEQKLPLTIRAVFIINPENKLMLSLNYPACGEQEPPESKNRPQERHRVCASHPADTSHLASGTSHLTSHPTCPIPETCAVGRNMDEIVRCVKALQLSYQKSIATPANWPNNHPDLKDGTGASLKGSVFLLPTVSDDEAKANYPGFHTCDLPSKKPYLRLVKASDAGGVAAPAEESVESLKAEIADLKKKVAAKKSSCAIM